MSKKIFLDMDGVLADFVGGACQAHRRSLDYTEADYGTFELEKVWGISAPAFWKPIDADSSFWCNLYKTPEADQIVILATRLVGVENIAILTAPSSQGSCFTGKKDWIRKNFLQFNNRIIFGSAKEFLAGPDRILFDDRDKNIEDFTRAGGTGILVPRLWNRRWRDSDRVMESIEEQLSNVAI